MNLKEDTYNKLKIIMRNRDESLGSDSYKVLSIAINRNQVKV